MRRRLPILLVLSAAAGVVPATGIAQTQPPAQPVPPVVPPNPNPCLAPETRVGLRCPDLVMKRPFGLRAVRTRRGRTVLRAGNSIDNVGDGPAELHGRRSSRRYMRAHQHVHTTSGGSRTFNTGARLFFKFAHANKRYWKFAHAARFELWRVDSLGRRTRRVRRGPKVFYCLRDLRHSRRSALSPRRRVYPACNTNPAKQSVFLGTSVGWSDVYPPTYPEQYIDVTGLRGCFAYSQVADPRNGIYEKNEGNNRSSVVVRLPYRRRGARRCPGQRGSAPPAPAPAPGY